MQCLLCIEKSAFYEIFGRIFGYWLKFSFVCDIIVLPVYRNFFGNTRRQIKNINRKRVDLTGAFIKEGAQYVKEKETCLKNYTWNCDFLDYCSVNKLSSDIQPENIGYEAVER